MPIYDYVCSACETKEERRVAGKARDDQWCATCASPLLREEISTTQPPKVDARYQMKAVMSDGSHVPGHFGVMASKNKGSSR
jgi:putative FmdB family regulatory protein